MPIMTKSRVAQEEPDMPQQGKRYGTEIEFPENDNRRFFDHNRKHFHNVSNDSYIGYVKDWCIFIFVDCYNVSRIHDS